MKKAAKSVFSVFLAGILNLGIVVAAGAVLAADKPSASSASVDAGTLVLDEKKQIDLDPDKMDGVFVFSFTPAKSGYYCFRSISNGVDPMCDLFDKNISGSNHNGSTTYFNHYYQTIGYIDYAPDFKLLSELSAGVTYSLEVSFYVEEGESHQITSDSYCSVWVEAAYLKAAKDSIRLQYGKTMRISSDIFDTNYDFVHIPGTYHFLELNEEGEPTAVRRGKTTLQATGASFMPIYRSEIPTYISAPAQTELTIYYTFWQWLAYIFVFSWLQFII